MDAPCAERPSKGHIAVDQQRHAKLVTRLGEGLGSPELLSCRDVFFSKEECGAEVGQSLKIRLSKASVTDGDEPEGELRLEDPWKVLKSVS